MQRFFTVILLGNIVVGAVNGMEVEPVEIKKEQKPEITEMLKKNGGSNTAQPDLSGSSLNDNNSHPSPFYVPKDKEEVREPANKNPHDNRSQYVGAIPVRPFNINLTMEQQPFSRARQNQVQNPEHGPENVIPSFEADFNDVIIKEAQYVYQFAPPLAKGILKHLTDERGFILNPEYRVALFWGPPGCGKTMTSKHIGITLQKEHGWKFLFIPSARTARNKRNETAQMMDVLYAKILKDKKNKYFLAFDEINELFENTRSQNHDTNMTSKVTREFFDELLGNPRVFCVGTLNIIEKLEDPAKDRYFEHTIRFAPITNNRIRNACFRDKVTTPISQLDGGIDDAQLDNLLKDIDHGGRQLSNIATSCKNLCWNKNPDKEMLIITSDLITEAVKESVLTRTEGKYGQPEETDQEQRERHFQRSYQQHEDLGLAQRTQQAEQFREGQELQSRQGEASLALQTAISLEGMYYQSENVDKYDRDTLYNQMYNIYYKIFPNRKPTDYQALPESEEEAIRRGLEQNSCTIL